MNPQKLFLWSVIFSISFLINACEGGKKSEQTTVIMETSLGPVKFLLYNDTPVHKENFIELTNKGFYDGQLFHRVINRFVVQAGDPSTVAGTEETENGPGYTLAPEILEKYIHTAGKLCAARMPDDINPERRSSGSQFFVVTGQQVTFEDLEAAELAMNSSRRAALYAQFQQMKQDPYNPIDFEMFLSSKNYKDKIYYDKEKIGQYARKGGVPHLDFQYTIFGEVVTGMEIIRQIEQIPTQGERPLKEVRIISMKVMK